MSNQVVLAKRQQTIKFNVFYATILLLMTTMMGIFATSAWLAIINGDVFIASFSLTMLFCSIWSFGACFISIPMTMYLNKKYAEKRYSELDVAHSRALKLLTQLPLRKTMDIPVMMSNLALMRLCQGNYESAEELFRKANGYVSKDKRLKDSYASAILLNNLGCACLRRGNLVEAELHGNRALELLELPKNKNWKLLMALPHAVIGSVHTRLGELDTAEEHFLKALEIYNTQKPPAGTIVTSLAQGRTLIHLWLSLVTVKQGKIGEANTYCDNATKLIDDDPSSINTLSIEVLYTLANEFMNVKDVERAERLLEIAYGLTADSPYHPDAKPLLNYYEKLLLLTDRQAEVPDMRSWLRHVHPKSLAPIGS